MSLYHLSPPPPPNTYQVCWFQNGIQPLFGEISLPEGITSIKFSTFNKLQATDAAAAHEPTLCPVAGQLIFGSTHFYSHWFFKGNSSLYSNIMKHGFLPVYAVTRFRLYGYCSSVSVFLQIGNVKHRRTSWAGANPSEAVAPQGRQWSPGCWPVLLLNDVIDKAVCLHRGILVLWINFVSQVFKQQRT